MSKPYTESFYEFFFCARNFNIEQTVKSLIEEILCRSREVLQNNGWEFIYK